MIQIETSDNFDIGTVPIEKFVRSVSGFDLVDALLFIQKVNADLKDCVHKKVFLLSPQFLDYLDKWFLITTEANAFVAKHLINFSSEINYKKYDAHCHSKSVIYYHHLETDLNFLNSNDQEAYKWCIRAMNQQFHYLRLPSHIMGRYLILLDKIRISEKDIKDKINQMSIQSFGITPKDIMIIGTCIYALVLQNKILNLDNLINHTIDSPIIAGVLTADKIDKFLNMFSIDVEEFKNESIKWKSPNLIFPLHKYMFNPLWSYPMIRTKRILEPDKKHIIPSLVDLVYASSEGIYYKLMDRFRGNKKRNSFSEKFGKVFQEYIAYLLKESKTKCESLDKANCKNKPRPDYLIKDSNKIIQIEVKKRVMSNQARACVGVELENYIDDLTKDIYRQLFKPSQQYSHCEVYNVIVALDEWYYFEEKIKSIIENKLKIKAMNDGLDISKFKLHLLGCTDFEILCQFIKERRGMSIFKVFHEKEKSPYYYRGLTELLLEKYNYEPSSISLIESEFNNLFNCILGNRKTANSHKMFASW